MTTTVFIDKQTAIETPWLNDVNTATYVTLPVTLPGAAGSSLVGYNALRTVQSKLGDFVSILDYRVNTTPGVTDMTAALVAALATGKSVYIPTGTYLITSAVTLGNAGQTVFGSGHLSVLQQSTLAFDLFTITADDVVVRDLRFNGAATSEASGVLYWAIMVNAGKYVKIIRCKFSGATAADGWRSAIKYETGANNGTVHDCEFERLWGSSAPAVDCGYAILAGAVIALYVSHCRAIGTAGRGRHMVIFQLLVGEHLLRLTV